MFFFMMFCVSTDNIEKQKDSVKKGIADARKEENWRSINLAQLA